MANISIDNTNRFLLQLLQKKNRKRNKNIDGWKKQKRKQARMSGNEYETAKGRKG